MSRLGRFKWKCQKALRRVLRPLRRRFLPKHLRLADATFGMVTLEELALLYDLALGVRDGCIVEVGSFQGRSTVALAQGSINGSGAPVFAIEPHEEYVGVRGSHYGPRDRRAFFRHMLRSSSYRVVRLVNLSSEIVTSEWDKPVELVWIDGDHTYEGVKRDLRCWEPHLIVGGYVAFHDSTDPSLGPTRLVKEIVQKAKFEEVRRAGAITVLRKLR